MKQKVKVGYVGLGRRGSHVLEHCLCEMADVEIAYLCDLNQEALEHAKSILLEHKRPEPKLTDSYQEILDDPTIDAVIIMVGWQGRADMARRSMLAGKYTAIEVGCAFDLSECYQLIETYEKTGTPLMMLENCCYGRREMMVLKAVREGLFGEVVH